MKRIEYLVIHCSATREGLDVKAQQINDYHTKTLGWRKPGYSDVIEVNGDLVPLIGHNNDMFVDDNEVSNGAFGVNAVSRHICYVGGIAANGDVKDTRTAAQKATLEVYVKYMVCRFPWIKVCGHRDLAVVDKRNWKGCPSFDVAKWGKEIGLDAINIFKG